MQSHNSKATHTQDRRVRLHLLDWASTLLAMQ